LGFFLLNCQLDMLYMSHNGLSNSIFFFSYLKIILVFSSFKLIWFILYMVRKSADGGSV
jgi:hypothetical protein